ncbi:hypothetical protein PR202_ga26469 [Eleusine coracana subsp. coracana]|uniref:Uncharacterized protein n=1 Tax=Eleusine coracana subsp. coracana TaxID=191504 RepID=A0AAV5DE75_ELECO|nr:hypothetical protein PR202_ga26469 [Eleusine coracana subsp. coracana]
MRQGQYPQRNGKGAHAVAAENSYLCVAAEDGVFGECGACGEDVEAAASTAARAVQDTTEYTGDGSICARGHPASKKHTGKWKACSFALGNDDPGSVSNTSLTSTTLIVLPAWTDTNSFQHIIFFVGLYMVAVGYGVQSPCVTSFGADQFDDTDGEEKSEKSSFFNWHHFTVNAGVGSFLLGSTVYRFQKPGGSPITRVCQVLVAATHNFKTDLPCDSSLLYEIPGQVSAIEGSRKLEHTTGLEYYSETTLY